MISSVCVQVRLHGNQFASGRPPNFPNNDDPVRIIAQWPDEYLTANRIMMYHVAYIDETGTKQIMNAMDQATP